MDLSPLKKTKLSSVTNPFASGAIEGVDMRSKVGYMVFTNATTLPAGFSPMEPNLKNGDKFWDMVEQMDRAHHYPGAYIPTAGTGAILTDSEPTERFSMEDMIDYQGLKNLFDRHQIKEITEENVRKYSSSIWGKTGQTLTLRTPQDSKMTAYYVNPNAEGLEGDVAKAKIAARRGSEMAYTLFVKAITNAYDQSMLDSNNSTLHTT